MAEATLRENLTFAVEEESVNLRQRTRHYQRTRAKDKKLHRIFGDLHQPAGYPGKKDVRGADRESGEAHEWRDGIREGQSFYNSGREMHAIGWPSTCTLLAALHAKATDLRVPVAKEAERTGAKARRLGVERQQMREEMRTPGAQRVKSSAS